MHQQPNAEGSPPGESETDAPLVVAARVHSGDKGPPWFDRDVTDRVDGHILVLALAGATEHMVDFAELTVEPGVVLHVQPGQVHRWRRHDGFDGIVIRIPASICSPGIFDPATPRPTADLGSSTAVTVALAHDLVREQESSVPSARIMAASAALLLHHVARMASEPTAGTGTRGVEGEAKGSQSDLLTAFRAELETGFATTRSVADYARRIGTSQKTLSRATATLAGSSPKEIIDGRVILEARRLLAHSAESASSIGAMLGFSEPTNFTKFFIRHTGMSPQEFRVDG